MIAPAGYTYSGGYGQATSSVDPKVFMMIAGVFGGVAALGLLIVAAVTFIPKVNFQTASSAGVEGFREVNGGVTVTMNPQRAKPSSDMVERGIIAPPMHLHSLQPLPNPVSLWRKLPSFAGQPKHV